MNRTHRGQHPRPHPQTRPSLHRAGKNSILTYLSINFFARTELTPLLPPHPLLSSQGKSQEILVTGIKVVDLLAPYAKGGKIGLFGGAGVGKTVSTALRLTLHHHISVMRLRGHAHYFLTRS